jgi:hypothetical protein
MYRIFPLKSNLRPFITMEICTSHLKFNTISKNIHPPNTIIPNSICNIQRPWYKQVDNHYQILIINGFQFIDLYCPTQRKQLSFLLTSNQAYKNNLLYYDCPVILSISKGIFYRITNGMESTISICFIDKLKNSENRYHSYGIDKKNYFYYYLQ